ncbi:MAG: iron-containing alcohol dehydrogenase [Verrucomicrobia bacterium]|nr:iron-containing alcohol dehydrogenase [Verrucomicrobiota bacterium]
MRFELATAGRILFGPGTLKELEPIAADLGRRALIVRGRNPDRARHLEAIVRAANINYSLFEVHGEPTIERIEAGVKQAREIEADMVIGFGGGSVIDSAKAIAALATNPGSILEYLEVIGKGKQLALASVPCIAIPTTAGTGAEVTRNAVLASPAHKVKVSLRSPYLLPRLAVVDPMLTCDLSRSVTASTGLDALTQLIEPYVCVRSNPVTDGFCVEGLKRVARSFRSAFEDGHDIPARENMALASLFGGLSLANAGLGGVHGFASPIGGMFDAPHGAICAALLPHVMEINIRALQERARDSAVLSRYDTIATLLTGSGKATSEDGIRWVHDLCKDLRIPGLRTYGVSASDVPVVVEQAAKASSMKANPIKLTTEELTEVLEQAI